MSHLAPVTEVTAKREIILSAGSVGTPQILQLSGIGDEAALASVGIKSIVHNPSVGQNLSDHVLLPNVFSVNGNGSFDDIFRDPSILNADINEWSQNKSGPLVYAVANQMGWFQLPANLSIFETESDPLAGPHSSHYELIFTVRHLSLPL